MPIVHYVVIRRDLTFGEYSAQLAHAGEAYLLRRDEEWIARGAVAHDQPGATLLERLGFNETTCIVKGIRNEGRLRKLQGQLVAGGVPHVAIVEEEGEKGGRLAGQLTCISLMPAEMEKVEPFVREIHTIEKLDGPQAMAKCKRCGRDFNTAPGQPGATSAPLCVTCFTSNA